MHLHNKNHENANKPKILTVLVNKKTKRVIGHVYGVILKRGGKKVLYIHLICAKKREKTNVDEGFGRILLNNMQSEARRFNVYAIELYAASNEVIPFYEKTIIEKGKTVEGFKFGYINNKGNIKYTDSNASMIWVVPRMSNANRIRLAQNHMKIWPKNRHTPTNTTITTKRIQEALRVLKRK